MWLDMHLPNIKSTSRVNENAADYHTEMVKTTVSVTLLVAVSILSSLSSSVRNSRFGYGIGPFSKILHTTINSQ